MILVVVVLEEGEQYTSTMTRKHKYFFVFSMECVKQYWNYLRPYIQFQYVIHPWYFDYHCIANDLHRTRNSLHMPGCTVQALTMHPTYTANTPYIHSTDQCSWGICNIFKKCSPFFENDVVCTNVLKICLYISNICKKGSPVLKTLSYTLFLLKIRFFAVHTSCICTVLPCYFTVGTTIRYYVAVPV